MIGLVLATRMEAGPLLRRLDARKLADALFETHEFAGGTIVISGMGKRAARDAAEYLIASCGATAVVNVGICGAVSDELQPGEVLRVSAVMDGDRADAEQITCDGDLWDRLAPARLASVDEPVFEDDRRLQLARQADLVDMEGIAVAETCRRHGIACCMVKGVSDLADNSGKESIRENIERVSADLAEVVAAGLDRLAAPGGGMVAAVMRFAKIEHALFSLPLLFAGAWLGAGGGWPPVGVLALIALAGVGARTMGMAMNRVFDRRLDALNARTARRELPSGRMSLAGALGVAGGGLAVYLLACWALGPICLRLSPVPAVPLILYSLLKRFTNLCHFALGLCMALAPVGAYVAASDSLEFNWPIVLLAVFTFCWMSGFDIIYAIQDMASDRSMGVHSIPAALGAGAAEAISAGVHLAAVATGVWLWLSVGGGAPAGAALAVAVAGFVLGHWRRIPVAARFFPISMIAGIAGAAVVMLGGLR